MPLPNSAPLALLVNSNAVQSRPKRAMIVRMSAETLDALEAFPSHPPLSLDFGGNPGIYIGDTFFPMRPLKESSPHELYLRAASAAKPMAPLKLHANVIGKFMVERQLGEKVTDKVRQQTMVAKQQHMERQAILLDQPPISVPGSKKRKIPGSGKTPASDHLRVPSSSTAASRKVSPLPSSKASADVRRRLVRCLAISPRLADDAVKMVGGANISASARDDLLALLDNVAEQRAPAKKGDKSPRLWVLKPQTWTEVRPFEWPKLTEPERVAIARQARMVFKALKIPESDPAWENVRYRPAAPAIPTSVPAPPPMAATSSSRSSGSAHAETKRSATSSKDAKLKSKQDASRAKGDIQMKDESSKATVARVNAIKRAEVDRPSTPSDSSSSTKTAASRRLPGSGYQAKKTPLPSTTVTEKSGTSAAPKQSLPPSLPQKPSPTVPPAGGTHARKTIPTVPPKPVKKEDESDREKDRDYERQRERELEKRAREKEKHREERERERERVEMEKRERARQKEREAVEREREKRQREKEREREEMEQVKRQREKERISKERAAGSAVPASKRKPVIQDAEEYLDDASTKASLPKRRKLDDGSSVASTSKTRDTGLPGPKKLARDPSPVPRLKMRKDRSPQAPASPEDRRTSSGSTHRSDRPTKMSGSVKPRRRSPIYTSSEDEGEIPQPRKRNLSPPPVSDRSNSSDQPPTERGARHHRTTRTAYPPATDHAALRALYQSQYSSYLGAFSKIVGQKRTIQAMLNGDSEAEADVMDPDDLIKLSMEHQSLKTDLENILDIYTKGTTVGVSTSD